MAIKQGEVARLRAEVAALRQALADAEHTARIAARLAALYYEKYTTSRARERRLDAQLDEIVEKGWGARRPESTARQPPDPPVCVDE